MDYSTLQRGTVDGAAFAATAARTTAAMAYHFFIMRFSFQPLISLNLRGLLCIGAAEQAIARRELLVDTTELERRKLADARSMLKSLSIFASQGKRAAHDAAVQPAQQERLG